MILTLIFGNVRPLYCAAAAQCQDGNKRSQIFRAIPAISYMIAPQRYNAKK